MRNLFYHSTFLFNYYRSHSWNVLWTFVITANVWLNHGKGLRSFWCYDVFRDYVLDALETFKLISTRNGKSRDINLLSINRDGRFVFLGTPHTNYLDSFSLM